MLVVGREGFEPPVVRTQRIYSPHPLATWIPADVMRGGRFELPRPQGAQHFESRLSTTSSIRAKCPGGDSNPHARRRTDLNGVRLPRLRHLDKMISTSALQLSGCTRSDLNAHAHGGAAESGSTLVANYSTRALERPRQDSNLRPSGP